MKTCSKCKEIKDLAEFYKDKSRKDGLSYLCIPCAANPDKKLASSRASYRANPAKHRAASNKWRNAHREKARAGGRAYCIANRDKICAKSMKRHAAKLQRTPPWLTKEHFKEILAYYSLAKELQWLSEEKLEVDHIVPLLGENVCGLHVPWNLQILPKSVNVRKSNKLIL